MTTNPTEFIEELPTLLKNLVSKGKYPSYMVGNDIATLIYELSPHGRFGDFVVVGNSDLGDPDWESLSKTLVNEIDYVGVVPFKLTDKCYMKMSIY